LILKVLKEITFFFEMETWILFCFIILPLFLSSLSLIGSLFILFVLKKMKLPFGYYNFIFYLSISTLLSSIISVTNFGFELWRTDNFVSSEILSRLWIWSMGATLIWLFWLIKFCFKPILQSNVWVCHLLSWICPFLVYGITELLAYLLKWETKEFHVGMFLSLLLDWVFYAFTIFMWIIIVIFYLLQFFKKYAFLASKERELLIMDTREPLGRNSSFISDSHRRQKN